MEEEKCSRIDKCALFQKDILKHPDTEKWYHKLYCKKGEEGRDRCMRYKVFLKMGSCPDELLPYSTKTVDEVVEEIKAREQE